jgi:hypothetical protein
MKIAKIIGKMNANAKMPPNGIIFPTAPLHRPC